MYRVAHSVVSLIKQTPVLYKANHTCLYRVRDEGNFEEVRGSAQVLIEVDIFSMTNKWSNFQLTKFSLDVKLNCTKFKLERIQ